MRQTVINLFVRSFLVSLSIFLLSAPALAVTNYYVDPDWTGSATGAASTPWTSLTTSAWTTINNMLATDDVTVFFSARDASSDVDEIYDTNKDTIQDGIDLNNRTDTSNHILTLDGRSKYNTSDTSPTWIAYSGSSKCKVMHFDSQNISHVKRSYITIDGFRIVKSDNGKGVSICGDYWTLKNSEIYHSSGVSSGPLVLIVPTADAAHEGSGSYCPASNNITISDNKLHDSYGELLYIGGAGCSVSDATLSDVNCNGKPAHSYIYIKENILYNSGVRGGQGDGIDVKAGITNLVISGNNISTLQSVSNDHRGIVIQGVATGAGNQNILVERNYIHDINNVGDGMITLSNGWGTTNGVTIRNNIIDTGTSGDGIRVIAVQSNGVKIYNNTIYNISGFGISVNSGTVDIINNALVSNNSGGNQISLSGTITSTNNAYSGTWAGSCINCISGLTIGDLNDPIGGNFTPINNSSLLVNSGATMGTYSDDYRCTSRPYGTAWDIGALEWSANSNAPCPPSGFVIQ